MGSKLPLYSHARNVRWAAFFAAILLLGGALSRIVFAQAGGAEENATAAAASAGSYTEDPVDQTQKKKINDIGAMLRAGNFTDNQQEIDFDTYYKTYALPRWTQLSTLGNLRDYHKELFNNLAQAITKGRQVHDHLNELVLDYMSKLAKSDKYHPAVRYNAMLTIGDLNAVEGFQPTPLESALRVLLDTVNDANQIVPVKIAALIGINRHMAAGGANPQIQNQILAAMLKIADGTDAAETSDPGREWMRRLAVEILGLLGNPGDKNRVVEVLSVIIGDAKVPFSLRAAAAESLGKLKFAGAAGLNPVELAKPLAQLVLDACNAELSSGKETKLSLDDHRRNLKSKLVPAMDGLNAAKQLAKGQAQQNNLNNLKTIFDDLFKGLDNTKIKSDELKKCVEDCQTKLVDWLEKKP